jgi:hypothetical protein
MLPVRDAHDGDLGIGDAPSPREIGRIDVGIGDGLARDLGQVGQLQAEDHIPEQVEGLIGDLETRSGADPAQIEQPRRLLRHLPQGRLGGRARVVTKGVIAGRGLLGQVQEARHGRPRAGGVRRLQGVGGNRMACDQQQRQRERRLQIREQAIHP